MVTDLDSSKLIAMRDFIWQRQDDLVDVIRRLVEIESPSGDVQGSWAVVDLLEASARTIPSVSSIERINSPDYGDHLLIRAFCNDAKDDGATLILGHTDTVHPRGTFEVEHGLRAESDRLYGPGIFD